MADGDTCREIGDSRRTWVDRGGRSWLRAFRHHWPGRFERVLGARGEMALKELGPLVSDAGRYLELRRIAIENLAAFL
jgi:hypothetical protein